MPHPKYVYDDYSPPELVLEVPDWRMYKIKGIPELEYVETKLARQNLRDPWLRNEVWRFPSYYERHTNEVVRRMIVGPKGRDLFRGLFLASALIIAQHAYYHTKYGKRPAHVTTLYDWLTYDPKNPHHH